jgi:hypothetical protein
MNKLSGYKKGDEVEVVTSVVHAGTPQSGETFKAWKTGVVIGEGFTGVNAFGDLDQQKILINVNGVILKRNAAQIK